MSRGYNNIDRSRERASEADQRYDSFYGNQNQKRGNYVQPQQGFNNNPNQNLSDMISNIQQQNLLTALLNNQNVVGTNQFQNRGPNNQNVSSNQFQDRRGPNNQNVGSNQFQDRRGPRRDGSMNGFSHGRSPGGAYRGGERSGDKRSFPRSQSNRGGKRFAAPPTKKPKEVTTEPKEKEIEEDIEIPDEDVVVSDELKLTVEKLRERTEEIERNAVDEDVEKLKVFSFNGKGYRCASCDVFMTKEASFKNHLMSKNHVMKVIDARTNKKYQDVRAVLDINLDNDKWFEESDLAKSILTSQAKVDMKVAKLKELKALKEYNSTADNFYRFEIESRKSAIQVGEEVLVTSLVESTVAIKDFSEGRHFGCEFVQPVTGFHCRLCSINIRKSDRVMMHINSKSHKSNYAAYIAKNKNYEKTQKTENVELNEVMKNHEGNNIVLAESGQADGSRFLSQLDSDFVRIPSVMNPELKKKEEKKETVEDEKENVEENGTENGEEEMANGDHKNESEKDEEETANDDKTAEDDEVPAGDGDATEDKEEPEETVEQEESEE